MSLKEGGRGVASFEDCLDPSIQEVEEYIKTAKKMLYTLPVDSNGYSYPHKYVEYYCEGSDFYWLSSHH